MKTLNDTSNYMPIKCYKRYGSGLMQTGPLTADEQKYDDTCRQIDDLERKIGGKSMSVFTANEFMWFNYRVNKMYFFPKQEQLDRQLSDLRHLLTSLEERERKKVGQCRRKALRNNESPRPVSHL